MFKGVNYHEIILCYCIMTQYKHERTCPFLRLLNLTNKLDYNDITANALGDGLKSFGFPYIQGYVIGIGCKLLLGKWNDPMTIDDVCTPQFIEHFASLVKTDDLPHKVDPYLLERILSLDKKSKFISPQSLLRYTLLRNVESWVETEGKHFMSIPGFGETCLLLFLLHEGYENDFGVDRTKLETFLRGDEAVSVD